MPYRFATEDRDYSDFSAGRVLMGLPGLPAFPVRLASEMFQRAWHWRSQLPPPHSDRLTVYDPTCGGAYHLTALGFLHGDKIGRILASDIDPRAVNLAAHNLSLLYAPGLDHREAEIRRMLDAYGKPSHAEALESVQVLRRMLSQQVEPIETFTFPADALDPAAVGSALSGQRVDIVLSDLPYGNLSAWQVEHTAAENSPAWRLLEALRPNLPPGVVIALAVDKSQKIAHEGCRRLERFQIGKRQVTLLTIQ